MQERADTLTLNRQQFQRMAAELPVFARLEGLIGAERAPEVVRLLYERRLLDTNPDGRYVLITGNSARPEQDALNEILKTECRQVADKRAYVDELLAEALEGKLRTRLGTDDALNRRFVREADIRTATAWICRTLHGSREDVVHALLTEHAVARRGDEVLGRTLSLLDRLYARIFPNAPASRGPNPETAYPSSISGRLLLEEVFARTAGAVWPLAGDVFWLDVALFFMAAIGTVQGYADGNKRAARLAYALILLRGRRAFIAPSPDLESDLFRMTGGPGS